MAGYLLRPLAWVASPVFGGEGNPPSNLMVTNESTLGAASFNGDADGGTCTRFSEDAKDITIARTDENWPSFWMMFDPSGFPPSTPITRVKFRARVKGVNCLLDDSGPGGKNLQISWTLGTPNTGRVAMPVGALGAAYSVIDTDWMTVNPATGLAWEYADLFHNPADLLTGFAQVWIFFFHSLEPSSSFGADAFYLLINEDVSAGQWCFNATSNHFVFAVNCPGAPFVSSDPPVPTITGFRPRST